MGKFTDITGQRFVRLLVLSRTDNDKFGSTRWLCKCDCGKIIAVVGGRLRNGRASSCGCLNAEQSKERNSVHGHYRDGSRPRTFLSWKNMKERVTDPNHRAYPRYGGRGITMCDRWKVFENFLEDMGEVPPELSLERLDNDGNYEPSNCKWATRTRQMRNTCKVKLSMEKARAIRLDPRISSEVAAEYGVSISTICDVRSNKLWKENQRLF